MEIKSMTFHLHHGGSFVRNANLEYVGGDTVNLTIPFDYVSIEEIRNMVKSQGYTYEQIKKIFYLKPNHNLHDGLVEIIYEGDTLDLLCMLCEHTFIELYVEHATPNIVSLNACDNLTTIENGQMNDDMESDDDDEMKYFVDEDLYSDNDDDELVLVKEKISRKKKDRKIVGDILRNEQSTLINRTKDIVKDGVDVSEMGDMSDYDDSDILNDIDITESEEDMEKERNIEYKFPTFYPKTKPNMIDFEKGLQFTDKNEFIDAVQNYKILNGYAIKTYKSDKNRIGAQCSGQGCKWRVWASWKCGEKTFQIKALPTPHTCVPFDFNEKSRRLTSRWLCKRYLDKLRICPSWKLREFRDYVNADINIEPSMTLCMRAKQDALKLIVGDYKEQFGKLRDYAFELLKTNEGSTVKIETNRVTRDGPPVFNGIYVCLNSLRKGMLQSCRKVICLDGCFLKGPWNGQILVAVGRDANNQMYPFAWAVVPRENFDRWSWFMKLLIDDLCLGDGSGWTIISDQQKGLVECIKGLLKEVEHRLCARHVYANLRKKWKGNVYKKIFWQVAKSTTKKQFDDNMKLMKDLDIQAHQFLLDKDPSKWCRMFFRFDAQCDSVDNNMAEVFNGVLLEARYKPIVTMLEDIRETMMVRVRKKKLVGENMIGNVCPRIQTKLQSLKKALGGWKAISNGVGRYSVKCGSDGYVVNIPKKHCECNGWDLTGIPCIHAVTALKEARVNPEDYVSECYSVASFINAYSYPIEPLNNMNMWPISEGDIILAPEFKKKKRGKQQHKRRREEGETNTSNKYGSMPRLGRKMKCSKCGDYGHNKKTCRKETQANI